MNYSHTIVIAEAGVNHNGSIKTAKKMIDVAVGAGVDFIKFQTFKASLLVTKQAEKADYQKSLTLKNESQFEMIRKLELDKQDHEILIKYCNKKNIQFLSAAFDLQSLNLLDELGLSIYKIPSGELTNLPYLREVGSKGKQIIMSTGMSTMDEVSKALNVLMESGSKKENITLLHCNTEYPTKMKDVNLKAMITMKKKLGVSIGYSDHTLGIEVPIGAVALGAKVIEKHFTLDRNLPGPDHKSSLEPNELTNMVSAIRNVEKALGSDKKNPSQSEIKNILIARKSIVASTSIKKGEKFSKYNLTVKRPGSGVSPMEWDKYLGKKSDKDYKEDELI